MCRKLSAVFSAGTHDDLFWRSAMSGGRATLSGGRGTSAHAGDITATHAIGEQVLMLFTIEVKFYADWRWSKLAYCRSSSEIVAAWRQAVQQTVRGRQPLLLTKENRRGELIITNETGYNLLLMGVEGDRATKYRALPPHLKFKPEGTQEAYVFLSETFFTVFDGVRMLRSAEARAFVPKRQLQRRRLKRRAKAKTNEEEAFDYSHRY